MQVRERYIVNSQIEVLPVLHYHQSVLTNFEVVRVYIFENLLLVYQLSIPVHASSSTQPARQHLNGYNSAG